MSGANGAGGDIERAIATMLKEFRANEWMLKEHWPMNEPHVRLMIKDVMDRFPRNSEIRILDVGCMNGYISFIFKQLGYEVTGTDGWELEDRRVIFARADIEFLYSNLNDLDPFASIAAESFDIVIIAQVIEHILNHPLGLMRSLARVMRPDGLLILTTPNPANVMGAARVLRGCSQLWGTQEFIDQPKFDRGEMISQGDIHYREYTSSELCHLLRAAGLRVESSLYLGLGNSQTQSALKKFLKGNTLSQKLMSRRLFASNHYFLARRCADDRD